MKGIVFIPAKRLIITTDFDEAEKDRISEIIDILGSVDIKVIPFKGNIIYALRKEQTSLPTDKGMCGCIVQKNVFLGNAVILGIDEKGNDLDCSLDMAEIQSDFQIKIFTRDNCLENNS